MRCHNHLHGCPFSDALLPLHRFWTIDHIEVENVEVWVEQKPDLGMNAEVFRLNMNSAKTMYSENSFPPLARWRARQSWQTCSCSIPFQQQ